MKKIIAFLCVCLVAVALSACSVFYNDTTKTYTQDNPQVTTIFLGIKQIPQGSTLDAELTQLEGAVYTYNEQFGGETDTQITDLKYVLADNGVYRVDLTIRNVPDSTVQKTTRPFQITYTQNVYNPLQLLPESSVFQYNILFSSKRRYSSASTTLMEEDDGEYVYFWTDETPISFTNVYPNRPLYLIIIWVGSALVGVMVYFISRYCDCKKRKKPLY